MGDAQSGGHLSVTSVTARRSKVARGGQVVGGGSLSEASRAAKFRLRAWSSRTVESAVTSSSQMSRGLVVSHG